MIPKSDPTQTPCGAQWAANMQVPGMLGLLRRELSVIVTCKQATSHEGRHGGWLRGYTGTTERKAWVEW